MQTQLSQFDAGIKMMVATDIHLGANDSNGLASDRYLDAFVAFEEVLKQCQKNKVDFLLIGGDLFHEKRPSEHCQLKCVEIMSRYVFGSNFGGIKMEVSDYRPNFSSQDFNIQLPIFIINGNHDNFISENDEHVSILDILHESKYVNYFGKVTDQSTLNVKPLILIKGVVRIALYGIGYMKDYQMNKMLQNNRLTLQGLDPQNFNILVIHQNRYKGTHFSDEKDFIDPIQFRKFGINLLIWGHEHEAKYTLESVESYQVFQAGSTVITSLIEAEGLIKQCGLFTIDKGSIEFNSIKLNESYRPLIIKNCELAELVKGCSQQYSLQEQAERKLFDLVEAELRNHYANSQHRNKKPLLRFKVEYSGFEVVKIRYLEAKFADKVANPDKIFHFWERRAIKRQLDNTKLDKEFKEILTNKNYQQKNEQAIYDYTSIVMEGLQDSKLQLFNNADYLYIMESTDPKSEEIINNQQQQITNRHQQQFYAKNIEALQEIVVDFREQEELLFLQLKHQINQNFNKSIKIDQDVPKYTQQLHKTYDKFLEKLKQDLESEKQKNSDSKYKPEISQQQEEKKKSDPFTPPLKQSQQIKINLPQFQLKPLKAEPKIEQFQQEKFQESPKTDSPDPFFDFISQKPHTQMSQILLPPPIDDPPADEPKKSKRQAKKPSKGRKQKSGGGFL